MSAIVNGVDGQHGARRQPMRRWVFRRLRKPRAQRLSEALFHGPTGRLEQGARREENAGRLAGIEAEALSGARVRGCPRFRD